MPKTSLRAFRHRNFTLYTFGNGFSLTGTWMQRLALGWFVWETTHSGFWLGALSAADLLPVALIGPLAGVVADRYRRLSLTILTQVLSGVVALALALLAISGLLNLATLLTLAACQGSLVALNQPSRLALVQLLVPRKDVGAAVAMSSVNVNLARITGPALGGWMLVQAPGSWIFALNALLTFGFIGLLLGLRVAEAARPRAPRKIMKELLEGFSYTLGEPNIRKLLLFLFLGGVFLRSMLELAPAVAERSFDAGELGLALLTSSMAAGAVLGGLFTRVGQNADEVIAGALTAWALGAVSVCLLALDWWEAIPVFAMALVGFFVTRGMVGTQIFVQLTTPDSIRGRALSIHGIVARASPAVGAVLIGALSEFISLGSLICAGGVLLLALVLAARMRR